MTSRSHQGVAVAISAGAHVVLLIALIALRSPPEKRRDERPPISIEVVEFTPPAPAEPLAVAVLEPEPASVPAPTTTSAPAPIDRKPPRTPAASASTHGAASETAPPSSSEPGTGPVRSSMLDMRRGRAPAVDLRVPSSYNAIDRVPRGTNADLGPKPTGQLWAAGGGTYRSNQGEFTANIASDGSVKLADNRSITVEGRLPSVKDVGNGLSDWFKSEKGRYGEDADQTLGHHVGGGIDGGDNALDKGDRTSAMVVGIIGGKAELTDAIMRGKGIDPYASKKLKFLDSTRDERVQIGQRHRTDQLRRTSEIIQHHLDRVARLPDPAARRAALFELWDEVVESGDAALVDAGRAARARVIGVIRARYATGSPDQYTPDELAALNRRRQSKTSFAPYE